ncbi:MAG: DUF547 domain-containing protein [Ferruginibacter sp.]|nr:DUF547 domain-containing protein [Chitinophagaceae bacterium]
MKLAFTVIYVLLRSFARAQEGYAINDVTSDFQVNKILNYTESSTSFQHFKDRLLVIDFFGTWCIPCIKAVPKLSALQQKYKDQVRILLVSDEPVAKLESFIKKQANFTLPLIVDEQGIFTKLFKPPSYPYTVIVGQNGKIIAIPAQEDVTDTNINKWLVDQNTDIVSLRVKTSNVSSQAEIKENNTKNTGVEISQNKFVQLSQQLVYAAKTGDETSGLVSRLSDVSPGELMTTLRTDNDKKAFWINLYNAYTQLLLKNNPDSYKRRGKFFGSRQIKIAGHQLSLDDIEHGILRRSKIKWSLGHLNKLFPGKTEKQWRVEHLDYRLHFALNCGARSCPPIAFYKPETIDQQLDLATKAYLAGEAEYDKSTNIIKLPALMGWFRKDFGGKKGMIGLLEKISVLPAGKKQKVKFKAYDWSLYLQNYKS